MSGRTTCYREKIKGVWRQSGQGRPLGGDDICEESYRRDERGSLVAMWGRVSQTEGLANAKALRSECNWCVQGTLWLG